MKIVLCIKQVPDTSDIKWTENNTINREGVESILNPSDLYAIETALRLKESVEGTEIVVVSMGPKQAETVIRKAIALGCDNGYLLSDKKFAGADTFVTAKTLAKLITTKIPDFDLVLCGQFAADGDTAQTGPSLAKQLGIAQITYVRTAQFEHDALVVERETETSTEKYDVKLPALLCVSMSDIEPRRPKINGFINAKNAKIETLCCSDIDMCPEESGLKGSPTYVSKAFTPKIDRDSQICVCEDLRDTVSDLVAKIKSYV